ncbi:MAG: hypothetical protein E1N59_2131 [Puniceicoccaceae bacterium 5H]|nr:MAG: hypothetical protein E1N59_2131 [Puniceicoccaceae bacterium 5H]
MKYAFLSFALLPGLAATAAAQTYGFETDLSGWTTGGNVAIEDASTFGPTATEGSSYVVLDTGDRTVDMDFGATPTPNPTGVTAADLGLGLDKSTLDAAFSIDSYDLSYLSRTFTVNAGDTITFDWKFLTNEFPDAFNEFNDTAFFATSFGDLGALAQVNSASYMDFPSAIVSYESDWMSGSITATSSGSMTLLFGVVDDGGNEVASMLAVDNLTITAVPEPSTYAALAGLGVLGLVVLRRRRQ